MYVCMYVCMYVPGNGIEALAEVRLDGLGVPGLREDLEQLVVGEKVEPREEEPLLLQVVLETLLDLLQEAVVVLERVQQAWIKYVHAYVHTYERGEINDY